MSKEQSNRDANLISAYASEGGTQSVFTGKVGDYIAARPAYPVALFEQLENLGVLAAGSCVADVGAGTGLLTLGFLERGYSVVAVEPNAAMRVAADRNLARFASYRSVEGSAEKMPLPPESIDLIAAAQAFHWFNLEEARREFLRVLKPTGSVALIWNDRLLTDPLQIELNALFAEFGGAKREALVASEDRACLPIFFSGAPIRELTVPNEQRIDQAGLLSLVISRSYMPARDSAAGKEVEQRVVKLFDAFAENGGVTVRYRTVAFVGRPSTN